MKQIIFERLAVKPVIRRRTYADIAVYIVWIGILFFCVFAYWGQSYDDVFLAYRYAHQVETGHGFVFNVGENFLGTPAPLFVVLLVIVHKMLSFLTIPQVGSLLSGFGLAIAGLTIYEMGRHENQRLLGALTGFLVVFNPLTILVMGGETPIYLAFITVAIYGYITERHGLVGIVLALALMNRTEALVPTGLLFGLYLLEKRRLPWRMGLLWGGIFTPWVAFATWQFGSPLTRSFTAKVAQVQAGAVPYPESLWIWMKGLILKQDPYIWFGILLMLFGVVMLAAAPKAWRILAAWTILQTAAYASLPIPFYHWYAAQIGILTAALTALGGVVSLKFLRETVQMLLNRGESTIGSMGDLHMRLGRQWRTIFWVLAVVIAICLPITLYAQVRIAYKYHQAWPHSPANLIYEEVGLWFAQNTPTDARIAYLEIGAIGYYSDRYIIDTLGLITPGVSEQVAKRNWLWPFLAYKPDYIVYNPMFDEWTDSDAIFTESWFTDGFEQIAQIERPPYPTMLTIYGRKPGAAIPDPVVLDIVQEKSNLPVGELVAGMHITQQFVSNSDGLAAIELHFATYARHNSGTVKISLIDSDGTAFKLWQRSMEGLMDNTWYRFYLDEALDASSGKRYTIAIESPDSTPNNAVTLWYSDAAPYSDGNLTINQSDIHGALAFRTYIRPVNRRALPDE